MPIKRYKSEKDNTISSAHTANLVDRATKSNMGSSDVLESFSIFAQASSSSLEQSRIILDYPISTIYNDRLSGNIPESGSVRFKLKLFNAPHGQTTPEKFYMSAFALTRDWTEGFGLDMESYLDLGSSNWLSASDYTPWHTTGSDYADPSLIKTSPIDLEYKKYLETGTEDLEFDITPLVEQWFINEAGNANYATSSINIGAYTANKPSTYNTSSFIEIYAADGQYKKFILTKNITGSSGNTIYIPTASSAPAFAQKLYNSITSSFGNKFSGSVYSNGAAAVVTLTSSIAGLYGNRVSTVYHATSSGFGGTSNLTIGDFASATGAINYGLLVKMSRDFEDGSLKRSFYTKKFFSRSSQYFFKRPIIEAQWASGIKDDRGKVQKSSSLAPASDNLNSIYLYNHRSTGLVDIPSTGSKLLVGLYSSSAENPELLWNSTRYVTASKVSTGVYKADFAYTGNASYLYDVWFSSTTGDGNTRTGLITGSGFAVNEVKNHFSFQIPDYTTKITNLKPSYTVNERATFRIYTRNKNWQPNAFTKATQRAPIDIIEDAYFKLVRVADNYCIIPYSTGSLTNFSNLSYDISGSFFDLDMSILEPNYLYEISFLYKNGSEYKEQKEKFKFRVDP